MRIEYKVASAMLASTVVGGLAVHELHAQAKAPVYFIGEIDVTNPDGYAKEYLPKARALIKAHGGRLIAAGGAGGTGAKVVAIDGEAPRRVVIYMYDSLSQSSLGGTTQTTKKYERSARSTRPIAPLRSRACRNSSLPASLNERHQIDRF